MRPRSSRRVRAAWALLLALGACRAPSPAAGVSEAEVDVVELARAYLRIDTTNPPGHELDAAHFLASVLARHGIEHRIVDLGDGRANLVARVPGDGARRPIVLLHHMDVVPADARAWTVPPFAGALVGGQVYGRGAVDIKGKGAIDVATLVRVARRHPPLHRDVILLAVADEEVGSTGSRYMVEHERAALAGAELLLDEGASVHVDAQGHALEYLVSVGEKAPLWLTLTFTGEPGHGSVPPLESAMSHAVRAASRLLAWRRPPRASPALLPWLRTLLAGAEGSTVAGWAGSLDASLARPAFLEALAATSSDLNAALRDTVSITGLHGGDAQNVIPAEVIMRLDCRLLPGTQSEPFIDELRRVVDDPGMTVRVDQWAPTAESPADGPLLRALARVAARRDPGTPVVPTLLVSSTDASLYRRLGIQAYGFEPYRLTDAESDLAHGNDERLGASSLRDGVELLTELLGELDAP